MTFFYFMSALLYTFYQRYGQDDRAMGASLDGNYLDCQGYLNPLLADPY
jgi:hypothetical protein